jgi:hypothetical protein
VLDNYNQNRDKALIDQLRTIYRSRPFTKAIPFSKAFPGLSADEIVDIWIPQNSYFEVALITIRASIAGVDLALCDTTKDNPFLFVMPPTTIYQEIDLLPGYRSLSYNGARLVANDPTVSGTTIKGVVYGWEVTPGGYYR